VAHKKGVGASRNGRDTAGKRLGVKKFDGQMVGTGTMLVRQRGSTIHAGFNVGVASDYTLFALCAGKVKYGYKRGGRKVVSIIP